MSATARWTGLYAGCKREREIATCYDHAAKALCDKGAARPHQPPRAYDTDGEGTARNSGDKRRKRSGEDFPPLAATFPKALGENAYAD